MDMEPRPIQVKALENYNIYLKFETGEEKIYDMKTLIKKYPFYSKLKDEAYFKNVKTRGCTIEWENGEDVAPELLYNESTLIK